MKFVKGSLLTLFFMLLLISAGATWLLLTENGSQKLIRTTLELTRAPVRIDTIKGTLGNKLTLNGLHWQQDGKSLDLEYLHLDWEISDLLNGFIHIERLVLQRGKLVLPDDQAEADFAMSMVNPLRVRCDYCEVSELAVQQGEQQQTIDKVLLVVDVIQQQAELEKLSLLTPLIRADLTGTAEITEELPFQLQADWTFIQPDIGAISGKTRLAGNLRQVTLASETSAPLTTRINGQVELEKTPIFNLRGSWQKAQWPLNSQEPQLHSKQGEFTVSGTPDQVAVALTSVLQQTGYPEAQVTVKANATPTELLDSNIQITTAGGQLNLNGTANWQNPEIIKLDVTTHARGFNPALLHSDLPGSVNLSKHIQGELRGNQFFGQVNLRELSGQLRDYPIQGKGLLVIRGDEFQIDRLNLLSGKNRLSANGQVTVTDANLDFDLDAPDLRAVWPGLSGHIQSRGNVSGSFESPAIQAELNAGDIRYESFTLENAGGTVDLTLSPGSRSQLKLTGTNLVSNAEQIDRFSVNLSGQPDNHQLEIRVDAADKQLATRLDGATDGKTGWQGQIANTRIEQAIIGSWKQSNSSNLSITIKPNQTIPAVNLSTFCLTQNQANVCFDTLSRPDGQLEINNQSSNLPLRLAARQLPDGVAIRGNATTLAHLIYADEKLSGTALLKFDPDAMVSLKHDSIQHEISLASSVLDLKMNNDVLLGKFALPQSRLLELAGQFSLNMTGNQSVKGLLHARVDDLTLIESLAPELAPVKGVVSADAQFSGTLQQPVIDAEARLDNGLVTVPPLGITVEKINFSARSDPDNRQLLRITAAASSGKGELNIKGQAQLSPEKGWPVRLQIKGKDFQAAQLAQAEVNLSPDLSIVASQEDIKVTGRVVVPKAHISIQKLPANVVTVSNDEVIITQNPTHEEPGSALKNLTADVTVELGSDIRFTGQGLSTGLVGKLHVLQQANETRVNGIINTRDGYFDAYGQKLTLSEGQFQFNGPADNPWLNVVASRRSRNRKITAYVTVQGPLKAPQTKISASDNSLSEQDALSYLITGRSLDRLGKSDKSNLASAALAFGADKATWLTEKIGIDQLDVTEGDTFEDTLVTLGSNLTPDFYVGVTIGLFDHEQNIVIKQSLTDNISVQAESGESQKVELKYDIRVD